MLLKSATLQRIQAGEVTLAFRRWKRPTVKKGGSLTTAIGVLAIQDVELVAIEKIKEREAQLAGYTNRAELVKELAKREGHLYKITLAYQGEDPRIELREKEDLSEAEFEELQTRLQRLDRASKVGPWTLKVLTAIAENPNLAAVELAAKSGYEKEWLKTNVRKLKNLGLTVSHHPGYTLSPRGEAVLPQLKS